jgi:hypothetical protein
VIQTKLIPSTLILASIFALSASVYGLEIPQVAVTIIEPEAIDPKIIVVPENLDPISSMPETEPKPTVKPKLAPPPSPSPQPEIKKP